MIGDALSALEAARAHPATDAQRRHLVGHSLGGTLAPEIVARDSLAAGMKARATIDSILAGLARLQRREASPDDTIMGAPASYFTTWLTARPRGLEAGARCRIGRGRPQRQNRAA